MFDRTLNAPLTNYKNARMTLTEILNVASILTLNIFSTLIQPLVLVSFCTPWKHQKTFVMNSDILKIKSLDG